MQPARCLIGLAGKLAASVQGAQDHLQRALVGKLRVRVDGNPAPVVADGDGEILVQFHLDAVGMARHRLVHRVVQNLCHQMMQRTLVRAADIHAGAFADGFQPFKDFDRGGVVIVGGGSGQKIVGHAAALFLWVGGHYVRRRRQGKAVLARQAVKAAPGVMPRCGTLKGQVAPVSSCLKYPKASGCLTPSSQG